MKFHHRLHASFKQKMGKQTSIYEEIICQT